MREKINCSITNLNSKKKIYKVFGIPEFAQKSDYSFASNYELKHLKKSSKKNKSNKLSDRIENYLTISKKGAKVVDTIPEGDDPKDYRTITKFVKEAGWLKRAQRKFHKIISKGLIEIPYLQSTLKDTSYAKNALKHSGSSRYFYVLDLKSFFEQVTLERIEKKLKTILDIDWDVASFYAKMLTSPKDSSMKTFVLGQGLPSSPIISFLCYESLFEHIYNLSVANGITFTIYVDDITFSSTKEIPQEFINTIMGLLKSKRYGNNLVLSKNKIHRPGIKAAKRITGVYLDKDGRPSISRRKHEELFALYEAIISFFHKENIDIDDFYKLFNLVLKFNGNFIHLCEVQYNGNLKTDGSNYAHQKYATLYSKMFAYFKIGIEKINRDQPYSQDNVRDTDKAIIKDGYKKYLEDRKQLANLFPKINNSKSILSRFNKNI